MSSQAQLRSLYRSLLRELPPRPILSSKGRSPIYLRLRQAFSSGSNESVSRDHKHAVAQGDQMMQYLKAQRQYVYLLERYNPGMGMDEEERIRLTARRVGMDLPKEFVKE